MLFLPHLSHFGPANSKRCPEFASEMALGSFFPATEWFGFRASGINTMALPLGDLYLTLNI